jgi:endonuclease G
MIYRLIAILLLFSNITFSQSIYTRHLKYGTPSICNLQNQKLVIKTQYISCYDGLIKTSRWITWNTRFEDYGDSGRYKGSFFQERGFNLATNRDYLNSGYDKGHIVPSEERTFSKEDNYETFSYMNVIPQKPNLNRGPWYDLEKHVREFVTDSESRQVFQMAGGIYRDGYDTIGNGIKVPIKVWKAILFIDSGKVIEKVYVIMPQSGPGVTLAGNTWKQFITDKKNIEKETGLKVY